MSVAIATVGTESSHAAGREETMRWIEATKTLELTARNVTALSAKLDDPKSARMILSGCGAASVHAVETIDPEKVTAAAAEGVTTLTRAQLTELAVEGATVLVAGITVTAVPDAAHYSSRPAGAVTMPSAGTVDGPDFTHWKLRHVCEVCGTNKILTPSEAYEQGWDYPPRMGTFGVIGPRTCGTCSTQDTVWAALMLKGIAQEDLTDVQKDTIARILSEPMSITVEQS